MLSINLNKNRLFTLLVMMMMTFCFCAASPASAQKIVDREALFSKALEKGLVRVIVNIQVDDYGLLLADSQEFKAGEKSPALLYETERADAALAGAIASAADGVVNELGAVPFNYHHIFNTVPALVLSVTPEGLAALEALPEVVSVVEDRLSPLPAFDRTYLESKGVPRLNDSTVQMGADDAWAKGYTGSGWYVAILDTGVRTSHEFFSGKTIREACYNTTDAGSDSATTCPNGSDSQTGTGAAWPPSIDGADHGTHVAGIAVGNNPNPGSGEPRAGVAKDADVIAINVFSSITDINFCGSAEPCVGSYDSDQVLGLEYVYSLRSQINIASANMSLGGEGYSSYCDTAVQKTAVDNLKSVGIATAIATGNEYLCGQVGTPACISTAVAVGSVNSSDVKSDFSNWHPDIQDLFAPGENINSSETSSDTAYTQMGGTSMATPHVAGAWAIMKQAFPSDSVDSILTKLKNNGQTVNVTGCNPAGSSTRIDVGRAVGGGSAGTTDIVWRNSSSGGSGAWLMNGLTESSWSYIGNHGTAWDIRGLGDFNADTNNDLLWRNNSTGNYGVWLMNGTTESSWVYIGSNGADWDIKGVGDFNNDGHDDIVWRNSANGNFGVWLMNGTTQSSWQYVANHGTSWDIRAVGDFNADGNKDIAWRNNSDGSFGIWLMNGTTESSWQYVANHGISWDIKGTGDFNADNQDDLVWRNSSGSHGVWYMNGTSETSWNYIANHGASWDIKGVGDMN